MYDSYYCYRHIPPPLLRACAGDATNARRCFHAIHAAYLQLRLPAYAGIFAWHYLRCRDDAGIFLTHHPAFPEPALPPTFLAWTYTAHTFQGRSHA